ncbi:MAG TPA: dTDP-4-dehydrorhamnose reductase [Gammaproteobacteria bacterium]|nr:dTDP-4-dehydrorhamnose reductase [Gammaproteobacteria bacterium]
MKVLITGAGGQLGQSLLKSLPKEHQILAPSRSELDIVDLNNVRRAVREFQPHVIVNAAAYTAVDKAESERELAFAVNAVGTENLGRAALEYSARLIHLSTDFVFDGKKSRPYLATDPMNPLGVYGKSKAEGEKRLHQIMGESAIILRTGWLYAAEGRNFVKTILSLLKEGDSLNVIADQVGTPTWGKSLAGLIWMLVQRPEIRGIHHWSDAGVASWYDFAVAIQEEVVALGLLKKTITIRPISTEEYLLPALRPAYSVLEKQSTIATTGITPDHWRMNLRSMLKELVDA